MRVLLTGATGQVGGALLPLLLERAHVIAPLSKDFDLSTPNNLVGKLDRIRPDLIVNPAAYTAVDQAEEDLKRAFVINAEAPAEIARWAARNGVPLIHFSTDYVFDGSGTQPWREDSPSRPLSVYGASKLAGDTAIGAAGGMHLIVRTSWVYATNGKNFLGTIARLSAERKELRVVADQFGAPTSARAIADAVLEIMPRERSQLDAFFERSAGIVNVVCSGETSWHGFAVAIVAGLKSRGMPVAVESIIPICTADFPARAKRPGNSRLDIGRLRNEFGVAMLSWEQALGRELDLFVA